MPECPIPVLIRLENIFYEINIYKKKNTGRSSIYCLRLVAWLLTRERNKTKQDKWVIQSKRKIAYYKRQFARNIAKRHEISLAQLPSATKFRSKHRSVQRNIVVMLTIGLPKYRRNTTPNESSLIFVEYSRNSSDFVCITFAQYCNFKLLKNHHWS